MSERGEFEVLVVGAGPVGLALGVELTRHGVSCRIVDRAEKPSDTSKALGVHARTLEVFEDMGVVEEALARGRKIHGASVYADNERIAHVGFDDLESPYPHLLILPQSETERVLIGWLAEQGVAVERPVNLVRFAQGEDRVEATLVGSDGDEQTVRARWMVGCDGAHSTVRDGLGLPFEGSKYEERFALADVRLSSNLAGDEAHIFLSPDGPLAVFPLPGETEFRLVADVTTLGENVEPTLALFESILEARGPAGTRISDPAWLSDFSIHRCIVPSYRSGRVFLAGDAAHIHSPVGGQGMNTGIQDSYNLGWKFGLVSRGAAADTLLDSYDAERRPVAAATLHGTDLATRVVTLRSPVLRSLRNALASFLSNLEVVQHRLTRTMAELNVHYPRSPIVAEHTTPMLGGRVGASSVSERPSMEQTLEFGAAPGPGERAPDVVFGDPEQRLYDVLRGTRHTLLLFDGGAGTAEGYRYLDELGTRIADHAGGEIDVHLVVPRGDRPTELGSTRSVLLDAGGNLHRRYGAGSECLYLIRPDGYVAFRAQPAAGEQLEEFLSTIFAVQ